jgi:formamidopyrimidine-DNA glycosylase
MPEGPEVRYLVELSKKYILGKSIKKIKALSRKKVYIPKDKHNEKIIDVDCKGKLMWIQMKSYYIHIHFGITGWLYFDKPDYTKYIIYLNKGINIYIDSKRKFTKMKIYNTVSHNRIINKLGIDILSKDFTIDKYLNTISNYKVNISRLLLNQSIFSGIGNYIRNESLYLSMVNPKSNTSKITTNRLIKLYDSIRYVAFSNLITWLKEYRLKIPNDIKKILPNKIQIPYIFRVYGRTKDQYGNSITLTKNIIDRKTYYVKDRQIH